MQLGGAGKVAEPLLFTLKCENSLSLSSVFRKTDTESYPRAAYVFHFLSAFPSSLYARVTWRGRAVPALLMCQRVGLSATTENGNNVEEQKGLVLPVLFPTASECLDCFLLRLVFSTLGLKNDY